MSIALKNKFSESVWKNEEEKFKRSLSRIKIPDENLAEVDFVFPKKESDFDCIPDKGGCYWIWTNEPVNHRFHKNRIPNKANGGQIIYNGIAKDNVRARIKHHLLGKETAGWSGISLDIYCNKSRSHRKKILSKRGKVCYLEPKLEPLRDSTQIKQLYLSQKEKKYIENNPARTYYFRNGIHIFDKKHKHHKFKIFFITGLETLYLEYVEKEWRARFGLPKLCSYSSGR